MNPRLMTRSLLVFLPLLCCSLFILAQNAVVSNGGIVTGKVLDAKTSKPLPGATIKVKNGTASAVADEQGIFSIKVPSSETVLSISHTGFLIYEIKAGTG